LALASKPGLFFFVTNPSCRRETVLVTVLPLLFRKFTCFGRAAPLHCIAAGTLRGRPADARYAAQLAFPRVPVVFFGGHQPTILMSTFNSFAGVKPNFQKQPAKCKHRIHRSGG
jgi:hypothetical protein